MKRANLKGDNEVILNDPTKCEGIFNDILINSRKNGLFIREATNFDDIKKNFLPIYYKLK